MNNENKLSSDEIALYDRQIRLWGMAAQARMRSTQVLLIGIGAIGQEIAKNIVLSGIGQLTLLDDRILTEEDLGSQFFVSKNEVSMKRLEAAGPRIADLNPRVTLHVDTDKLRAKNDEYFSKFDLIVGTELIPADASWLNDATRRLNIPLYITGSNGLSAYCFIDLIQFDSQDTKLQSQIPTKLGKVSKNRTITNIEIKEDSNNNDKKQEIITTRHIYKSFSELLKTFTFEGLHRRQIKRMSNMVPLTLALLTIPEELNNEQLTIDQLKEYTLKVCNQGGLLKDILRDESIEQMVRQRNIEFSPVAAIMGGAVAQDVINILGKKQSPLNNFIVFDGITLDMPIYEL
ncbi:hypothetical protein TBLA_0B04900 [Henningerozyma blattae CBS 6284]|uniref:THIF-type NAD/FAD binding fold domain-containing protein n=1 Tax=Henningerozyma blattae (strain ATCC 34711 / CBS 6284 / DSM 70876 / NBRC 10599 / NRRL Y-10934 / UCD 77-7) TaxID=1071380 RepID=I2GYX2_HENB6|nr:hypothetical protein TBLA_0B04900 [Tetrapisispora blattae CBS 6284]CCH59324.1 hypothetical protein TBLA_0B04900 [Tetrapisispora blattae CBS 6284]